ncbi:conserved hypothetical protein [Candidatus Brocadia pituitae]|nr:conserved hypothetical protein [Candidatus Brocadia pituitae]
MNGKSNLIVALSIFCLILFDPSNKVAYSDNLLQNSGFEHIDQNGHPTGWRISLGKNGKFKITNNSYEGKRGFSMENFNLGDEVSVMQSVPVKPHTDYVFSFMARANSMQELKYKVFDKVSYLPAYPFWHEVEEVYNSDNLSTANIAITLINRAEMKAWLDSVCLEEMKYRKNWEQVKEECCKVAQEKLSITDPEYGIGIESPLEKVMMDRPFEGNITNIAQIELGKNEHEAIQIVLIPIKKDLMNVTVHVENLKLRGGDFTLSSRNIRVFPLGYVYCEGSQHPSFYKGWIPDILLKLDSFHVKKDQLQPLWVDVFIPEDAKPGIYEGDIIICPLNSHEFPVRLIVKVFDITLPEMSHFEFTVPLQPDATHEIYGMKAPERLKDFRLFMADKRANTLSIWGIRNFEEIEELIPLWNKKFDFFHLGGYKERWGIDRDFTEKDKKTTLSEMKPIIKKLKTKEVVNKAYLFGYDELHWNTPQRYREILSQMTKTYGFFKKEFPELKLATNIKEARPELIGLVDIWIPQIQFLEINYNDWLKRKKEGDILWMYAGANPFSPYPQLYLDYPCLSQRIIPWVGWKYGATGFMYWAANAWRHVMGSEQFKKKGLDNVYQDTMWSDDLWSVYSSGRHAGGGLLIYPGPDGLPLSSVRLECLRDGIEDYEYLYMINEKIQSLHERAKDNNQYTEIKIALDEARILLELTGIVDNAHSFVRENKEFYQFRSKVLHQLEKILNLGNLKSEQK